MSIPLEKRDNVKIMRKADEVVLKQLKICVWNKAALYFFCVLSNSYQIMGAERSARFFPANERKNLPKETKNNMNLSHKIIVFSTDSVYNNYD